MINYVFDAFRDESTKIAASALRRRIKLIPPKSPSGNGRYFMTLDGEPIGHMMVMGGRVNLSGLDERFQGMGLGHYFYRLVATHRAKLDPTEKKVLVPGNLKSDKTLSFKGSTAYKRIARDAKGKEGKRKGKNVFVVDKPVGRRQDATHTTFGGKSLKDPSVQKAMRKEINPRILQKNLEREIPVKLDIQAKELINEILKKPDAETLDMLRGTLSQIKRLKNDPKTQKQIASQGARAAGPTLRSEGTAGLSVKYGPGTRKTNYQYRIQAPPKARLSKKKISKKTITDEQQAELFANSLIRSSFDAP